MKGIEDELRCSACNSCGFKSHVDGILEAELLELQRYVRTQFLCIPKSAWTVQLKDFIAAYVQPCLEINTGNWSQHVAFQAHHLAKRMQSGSLESLADLNLKMGCSIAAGLEGGSKDETHRTGVRRFELPWCIWICSVESFFLKPIELGSGVLSYHGVYGSAVLKVSSCPEFMFETKGHFEVSHVFRNFIG